MVTTVPPPGVVLAEVLFGKTRQRLLAWLLSRPDESFYLRELVRATGSGLGPVQRELAQLERAGIVSRQTRGKLVYFRANPSSPILPELRSILTKTSGVVDVLRTALTPVADSILLAFVYGSFARGDERSESDIDVMVIGDVGFGEVVDAFTQAQSVLQREINPTVYGPDEFREKTTAGHHFVTQVLREPKLFVMGGPNELGRLGSKRLVARGATNARTRARAPGKSGPRSQGKRHRKA